MLNAMEKEWAPHDNPVFQLTPTSFHIQMEHHYTSLGHPAISRGTFWEIYQALLACFRQGPLDENLEQDFCLSNLGADQGMDLLPGLRALQIGDEVVGDGVVLQEDSAEGDFTSDSDEDSYDAADFTEDEE